MQVLSRRHRTWLAMLQVVLLLAVMAMPAAAATTSSNLLSGQQWLVLLKHYNIVRGDERGNLNLDQPIKRAEMITIMVRALGAEEDAKLFKGLAPFTDVAGHWAEAEISYAAVQKLIKGDGNGLFRPEDYITYGEALTLLLRVVEKEPNTGEWPFNVLLVAGELGLVPPGVTGSTVKAQAIRGLIFQSMAKAVVDVPNASGRNVLQANLDSTAPTLSVTIPEKTESDKVRVTGTVEDAVGVTVNGKEVTLANNSFSLDLAVEYGDTTVNVMAWDWANNQATYSAAVTREFPVTALGITGPTTVAPGSKTAYEITAIDKDGQPVSLSLVTVKVDSTLGTFDKASGVLTAATSPGATGKITVSAGSMTKSVTVKILGQAASARAVAIQQVNNGEAVAYTRPMTVTVHVVDDAGSLVDTDYARPVTLTATGLEGVTVSPATATTVGGVATFTVRAAKMGDVTLSASSSGLESGTRSATFGSTRRIRLIADPGTLLVGGASTMARIKAELVDEDGKVVANDSGEIIGLELATESSLGVITDSNLTISKSISNSTLSGNDGMFSLAGIEGGAVKITGRITAGPTMTVDPVTVVINVPKVGAGTKLSALASTVLMDAPGTAVFVVRLVDSTGNYIPVGEYAFQVKVDTTNGEDKVGGMPDGMSVSIGDTGLNPVSDGYAEGSTNDTSDVIARTVGGVATIKVTYNKAGRVTLTPIAMGTTAIAYSQYGEEGTAFSSTGFQVESASMSFQRPVAGIQVTANSNIGNDQDAAAITNSSSSTTTLNVTITDGTNWIPGQSRAVTLTRLTGASDDPDGVQNTTPPPATTATTVDGKTSFVVKGTNQPAGMDTYQVSVTVSSTTYTDTIEIYTNSAKPDTPSIASVRGYEGTYPGSLNEVGPDEDGLEILLLPGTSGWAQARVFAEGSSSPIWTTEAIDFNSSDARILVPKDKLPAGTRRYAVTLRNGFGESARSEYSASVLNATYNTSIYINSARYDAATKKLFVYGVGFSTSTSAPDTVDTSRLYLEDLSTGQTVDLTGSLVEMVNSGTFTLTLDSGVYGPLEDPSQFGGTDIRIAAQTGWYSRFNGQMAAADLTNNKVTPGARVSHAVLDRSNKRLSVYGEGFTAAEIVYSKFKLTYSGAVDGETFTLDKMSPVRRSDTQLDFTLSAAALAKVDENKPYVVQITENGWAKDGTALAPVPYPSTDLQIFAKITVDRVIYSVSNGKGIVTISGSNFNFGTGAVNTAKMHILDVGTTQRLDLDDATVLSVSSNEIKIELSDTDKTNFEMTSKFNGYDIFLRATDTWTTDGSGRAASPIGDYDLRFPAR